MNTIDLAKLSKLVSSKTGEVIEFISIEKIGGGYHSDGFKLTTSNGKTFFLKYVRSNDLGSEFPERKIMSLMVSNGMGKRVANHPAPIGVIVTNEFGDVIMPDLTPTTAVYHLQEYESEATSYSKITENNKDKTKVDDEDRKQLESIADLLIKVHSVKHPSKDEKHLTALYNDGIRSILTNPELSITVLSEFPHDYTVLNLEGQKEMINLMYENIKAWMGRYDRLTALHGDFWGANILFKKDGTPFLIDFSRTPWGDPAIDAGWFLAEFIFNYHKTGNNYYKEMSEAWLTLYEQKTGDKEVRKAICLILGWIGIVQIYPRWFPNLDVTVGQKFIKHIMKILKNKEFVWDN